MPDIHRLGPAPVRPRAIEKLVPMRDGVRLAADVYLPEGDTSPGDTILIRLPYDKSGSYTFSPLIADYFMQHGYRVVAQDVRGKFRSEGETVLFVHEPADGYDTIEWVSHQPWSNGRVAMWGDSYYGYTQWAAASTHHPALKAISPRVTGTQLGEPVHRVPGAAPRRVEWAITYMYPVTFFQSNDVFLWGLDPHRRPFSAQVEEFFDQVGSRSATYDQWFPHPVYADRFPFGHPFEAPATPVLSTIGWWDNCAPLSWADVEQIQAAYPDWERNLFLRIEAMDHESFYLLDPPDARTDEPTTEQVIAKLPQMLDPTLEFFDVFVRGNGSYADIPRVSWNLAGTERQLESDTWPPRGAQRVTLAARPDGALVDAVDAVGADPVRAEWVHDPDDLVPSSVPDAFAFLQVRPDERQIGDRDDVLVFDAAAVSEPLALAGPVSATATVASTGPTLDLFVRLLDVSPDGSALRIARGQVHLPDASAFTTVAVSMDHVGYLLEAGHHLRLHLSSSDFPEFIPQPGTGEEPWSAIGAARNTQSVVLGGAEGLCLTFHTLPEW